MPGSLEAFCEILEWIKATDLQTSVGGKKSTGAADQREKSRSNAIKTLKNK